MKLKTRKKRESEYQSKYQSISSDQYERLIDAFKDKLNDKFLDRIKERISIIRNNTVFKKIHIIFYEVPVQSNRPRANFTRHGIYVPMAKENMDNVKKKTKLLIDDIELVASPMKIDIEAYFPIPKSMNILESILSELKVIPAIGKPDFDNITKAYVDMIKDTFIMDDDIVVESTFKKFYSFKPRVELSIIYSNNISSKYIYNKITSRKEYDKQKDRIHINLI